mmetsp:Transcript_25963/g.75053  ORF Transcript_25963/g.75053 Transcript_25963/m.75053 type:complete len:81 (+) Transcript_25963:395-637(+)
MKEMNVSENDKRNVTAMKGGLKDLEREGTIGIALHDGGGEIYYLIDEVDNSSEEDVLDASCQASSDAISRSADDAAMEEN